MKMVLLLNNLTFTFASKMLSLIFNVHFISIVKHPLYFVCYSLYCVYVLQCVYISMFYSIYRYISIYILYVKKLKNILKFSF